MTLQGFNYNKNSGYPGSEFKKEMWGTKNNYFVDDWDNMIVV